MGYVRWVFLALCFEAASRSPGRWLPARFVNWASGLALDLDMSRFRLW